eukprot:CAMPEP_0198206700 /NCGR_PEP_ID=MMETSP1445-20131203/10233_1 /TAXON_ID=36898 /ORGANISM="Pyramimonas sp., Strain CCMP2087" /LENGTH=258 /DNA_ID=CAMNT_0043879487 /DNA_START=576 /DNA_END=1352 /DNA_ORIENTATION=+
MASNLDDFDVVEEILKDCIHACVSISSPGHVVVQEEDGHSEGAGGCAICLDEIPFEDTAIIKGCEHVYCACCILKWVTFHKDAPRCPQCKAYFNYLYTYRCLDGTMCDHFVEESVTLLLRARWFQGKLPSMEDRYSEEDDDEDDDYDLYYLQPQHRVMLGNRRFGANGHISGGRQHAAPAATGSSSSSSKQKAKEKQHGEKSENKAMSCKKAQREAKKEMKADKEAQKLAQRKAARMRPAPSLSSDTAAPVAAGTPTD